MAYQVSGAPGAARINFAPSGVVEEVLQNIRTLITTIKYTVPLDRELGIDAVFIDRPAPDAMARLRVQIVEEIARYEPRAKIEIIEFRQGDGAIQGIFYPVALVEIIENGF
jgi:phage baseplate assembly protein W